MAFSLFDEDGFAGSLASIEGYGELVDIVQKGNYPQLRSMFINGFTQEPKKVSEELTSLLASGFLIDDSVRHTVLNFQKLMFKESKKEIVIVAE